MDPALPSLTTSRTSAAFQASPKAFRLWVKFFSQQNPSFPSVVILDSWLSFFIFLLLQSPTYVWAKDFLQSPAWDHIVQSSPGSSCVFSLPPNCPHFDHPVCPNFELSSSVVLEELDEDNIQETAPATTPKRKRPQNSRAKVFASEADLRRSLRLKKVNNGFKSSSCKDKNCLGCSTKPPTISQHVIRNLGKAFCNIDPDELTDEKLSAKPAAAKKKKGRPAKGKKRHDEAGDPQA